MNEYRGLVSIGRNYHTAVYANSAQHARSLVAKEYQRLHPKYRIADILECTSVQRVRF